MLAHLRSFALSNSAPCRRAPLPALCKFIYGKYCRSGMRLASSRAPSDARAIDYSKMMKTISAQKYYSLDSPLDILPIDEANLSSELKRLDQKNDSHQMLNLLTLWSKSSGMPVRQEHCKTLLSSCIKARDTATVNNFIMSTGTHANSPDMLRQALLVFGNIGATADARNVLKLLTKLGETVVWNDYNLVLNAAASSGNIDDFMTIAKEMQQQGIPAKLSFYNLALKTCVSSRDHTKALAMYKDLKASGQRPDKYTFGSLIQSYVNANDIDGASKILKKIVKKYPGSLCPHVFNHLMKARASKGDTDASYALFDQLKDLQSDPRTKHVLPDEYSYAICLNVASENSDKKKIIELVTSMYASGLSMNHETWRASTAPFGKTLDAEGLRELINAIVAQGARTTFVVWRDLIGILSRLGHGEQAYDVLTEMKEKYDVEPNQSCYIRVVRALCNEKVPVSSESRLKLADISKTLKSNEPSAGVVAKTNESKEKESEYTMLVSDSSTLDQLASLGYKDESQIRTTSLFTPKLVVQPIEPTKYMFDWVSGRAVITEMRKAGIAPTANIWRYVLRACVDSPHAVRGESVVTNFVVLLSEMYEKDSLVPRFCDWTDLINRLDFDDSGASSLHGSDANNSFVPLNARLGSAASVSDKEELLFFRMIYSFSPETQEQYLENAVKLLCKSADRGQERAFYILSHLQPFQRSHLPAWNALLDSYSAVGDSMQCHRVLKSFEYFTTQHAPISLWLRLIDSFAFEDRKFARAFEVADELILKHESKFGNYRSIDPDASLLVPFFNRMLEISVLANDPSNFSRYFGMLTEFNLEPNIDTFKIVGMQYVRGKRIPQFNECVDEMLRLIVSGLPDPLDNSRSNHGEDRHYVERIGEVPHKKEGEIATPTSVEEKDVEFSKDISGDEPDMNQLLVLERSRRIKLVNRYFPDIQDVLVDNDYWGVAQQLIDKVRRELSISTDQLCSRYMSKLAHHGKIEDAIAYAEKCIIEDEIELMKDLAVWHALLQQCKTQRRAKEAQFAMEKMLFTLGIVPDVFCWSLLISTYGDAGRLDDAANTLKDMRQYCDEKPPASCWNVLFEQYKLRKDPDGCLNLIQTMYKQSTSKHPANPEKRFSVTKILKDFIFQKKFDDSRSSAFVDEGLSTHKSEPFVRPTLLHWYHTLHTFALYRGGSAAYSELCKMRQTYKVVPSIQCYTCVLDELIGEDNPELIGVVLRKMHQDGVEMMEETLKRMEKLHRYDVILEVIEELSGKYNPNAVATAPKLE